MKNLFGRLVINVPGAAMYIELGTLGGVTLMNLLCHTLRINIAPSTYRVFNGHGGARYIDETL